MSAYLHRVTLSVVTKGQRWQLLTIASSVPRRCKVDKPGNTLISFLLKYLMVAVNFEPMTRDNRIGYILIVNKQGQF